MLVHNDSELEGIYDLRGMYLCLFEVCFSSFDHSLPRHGPFDKLFCVLMCDHFVFSKLFQTLLILCFVNTRAQHHGFCSCGQICRFRLKSSIVTE